jgi:hypothetical protein
MSHRKPSAGVIVGCQGTDGIYYVLLGEETRTYWNNNQLCCFWGELDADEDRITAAAREGAEESMGIFGDQQTLLRCLTDGNRSIKLDENLYFVFLGTMGPDQRTKVLTTFAAKRQAELIAQSQAKQQGNQHAAHLEMLQLVWVPLEQLLQRCSSVTEDASVLIYVEDENQGRHIVRHFFAHKIRDYMSNPFFQHVRGKKQEKFSIPLSNLELVSDDPQVTPMDITPGVTPKVIFAFEKSAIVQAFETAKLTLTAGGNPENPQSYIGSEVSPDLMDNVKTHYERIITEMIQGRLQKKDLIVQCRWLHVNNVSYNHSQTPTNDLQNIKDVFSQNSKSELYGFKHDKWIQSMMGKHLRMLSEMPSRQINNFVASCLANPYSDHRTSPMVIQNIFEWVNKMVQLDVDIEVIYKPQIQPTNDIMKARTKNTSIVIMYPDDKRTSMSLMLFVHRDNRLYAYGHGPNFTKITQNLKIFRSPIEISTTGEPTNVINWAIYWHLSCHWTIKNDYPESNEHNERMIMVMYLLHLMKLNATKDLYSYPCENQSVEIDECVGILSQPTNGMEYDPNQNLRGFVEINEFAIFTQYVYDYLVVLQMHGEPTHKVQPTYSFRPLCQQDSMVDVWLPQFLRKQAKENKTETKTTGIWDDYGEMCTANRALALAQLLQQMYTNKTNALYLTIGAPTKILMPLGPEVIVSHTQGDEFGNSSHIEPIALRRDTKNAFLNLCAHQLLQALESCIIKKQNIVFVFHHNDMYHPTLNWLKQELPDPLFKVVFYSSARNNEILFTSNFNAVEYTNYLISNKLVDRAAYDQANLQPYSTLYLNSGGWTPIFGLRDYYYRLLHKDPQSSDNQIHTLINSPSKRISQISNMMKTSKFVDYLRICGDLMRETVPEIDKLINLCTRIDQDEFAKLMTSIVVHKQNPMSALLHPLQATSEPHKDALDNGYCRRLLKSQDRPVQTIAFELWYALAVYQFQKMSLYIRQAFVLGKHSSIPSQSYMNHAQGFLPLHRFNIVEQTPQCIIVKPDNNGLYQTEVQIANVLDVENGLIVLLESQIVDNRILRQTSVQARSFYSNVLYYTEKRNNELHGIHTFTIS